MVFWPLRANTLGPKGAAVLVSQKEEFFKKLVAVDGGGQLLAVVHGQRLGCFAVEGVGKAGTRRAVPALVVGAAALSMPGTGHRARRWNTKEKRPFRAAGVVQGLQPLFQAIIECHVLGNRIDALSHQRQRSAFGHQRAIKANG